MIHLRHTSMHVSKCALSSQTPAARISRWAIRKHSPRSGIEQRCVPSYLPAGFLSTALAAGFALALLFTLSLAGAALAADLRPAAFALALALPFAAAAFALALPLALAFAFGASSS